MPPSALSPTYVLAFGYYAVFVTGSLIFDPDSTIGAASSADFYVPSRDSYLLATQVTWVLCAFIFGAIVALRKASYKPNSGGSKLSLHPLRSHMPAGQAVKSILLCFAAMIILATGNGWSNVYLRYEYIIENYHIAHVIGGAMFPVGVAAAGGAFTCRSRIIRVLALLTCFSALVLALGNSTRLFALIPLLFLLGALILQPHNRRLKFSLAICVAAIPLLINLPLIGRGMDRQGISQIPNLLARVKKQEPGLLIHQALNNVFCAQPIAILGEKAQISHSGDYLLTEINPLPGFMTDWKVIERRVNYFVPYNAIGELLRVGLLPATLYFAIVGFVFSKIDQRIRKSSKLRLDVLAMLGLSLLLIVLSLQYSLRTSTRLLYYMLLIDVAFAVFRSRVLSPKLSGNPVLRNRRQSRSYPPTVDKRYAIQTPVI
jgi:hypothetical protein